MIFDVSWWQMMPTCFSLISWCDLFTFLDVALISFALSWCVFHDAPLMTITRFRDFHLIIWIYFWDNISASRHDDGLNTLLRYRLSPLRHAPRPDQQQHFTPIRVYGYSLMHYQSYAALGLFVIFNYRYLFLPVCITATDAPTRYLYPPCHDTTMSPSSRI
jgi:hypothetical protein